MQRPLGVTIIAVVLALSGVFNIIVGLDGAGLYDLGLGGASGSEAQGWSYVIGDIVTILVSFGPWSLAGWSWTVGDRPGRHQRPDSVVPLFAPRVRSAFGR